MGQLEDLSSFMELSKFLSAIKTSPPLLPGTHVCTYVELRAVLARKSLEPTLCDVFTENLVYIFYGRPAFRSKSSKHGASSYHAYPTCMIFDLKNIGIPPKRIYPFDTGAFEQRYKSIISPGIPRDDFLLKPELDSAARVVSHYFGSNEAYFQGSTRVKLEPSDPIQVEARGSERTE